MKTTALTLTVTEAPLVTGLLALLCTCAQLATTSTLNVATTSTLNVAATSTLIEDTLHVFLLMFNRHVTTLPWNDWFWLITQFVSCRAPLKWPFLDTFKQPKMLSGNPFTVQKASPPFHEMRGCTYCCLNIDITNWCQYERPIGGHESMSKNISELKWFIQATMTQMLDCKLFWCLCVKS